MFPWNKDIYNRERYLAYGLILIAVSIWGISTPVIKATIQYVPPLTFLMLRFWIAGIITIPFGIYLFSKYKINWVRFKHLFISSMLGHVIALSLIFIGLERTSAIEGSLITSISPLLVTGFGIFMLREIVTRNELEGTLLAFIGTLIIIFEPLLTGHNLYNGERISFTGNLIFLGGLAFDGLYTVYIKRYLSRDKIIKPHIQVIFSFLIAMVAFTFLGTWEQYRIYRNENFGQADICTADDIDRFNYGMGLLCDNKGCFEIAGSKSIDNFVTGNTQYECIIKQSAPSFWGEYARNIRTYTSSTALYGILYMAIISGVLAYIVFQMGLKHIEASEASLFYYIQPLLGIPIAIAFLGETVSYIYIIGAIVTAFGIYLAEKRSN